MLVIVAAVAVLVVMVMLMIVAAVAVLVVVMMLMIMAAMAVLMMMVMMLVLQSFQILLDGGCTLHGLQKLFSGQFRPGGGYQCCGLIMLTQQLHSAIQLCLRNGIGAGQNDGGGCFDLIVVELTKVLHINLDLAGIGNCNTVAKAHILTGDLFHRCHHIGQLAHTGGFDDDPIRMVLGNNLIQSLSKVAHQRAADAAGVHLGNVNARFLQEASVDADLTKFIFDQHQLLSAVGFLNHFFDKGGLASSEKTGVNIDNCHSVSPSV